MSPFTDYESLGYFNHPQEAELLEAYSGTSVVAWFGNIERQLIGMEEQYKLAKNTEYADKIHTFLQTWRDNPIGGSMNVETLQVLEAAAAQNAVDPWKLGNYFSNLRDQLRKLIASQEELPLDNQPQAGMRRKSKPRPPGDFGPAAEAPAETPGEGATPPEPPVPPQ